MIGAPALKFIGQVGRFALAMLPGGAGLMLGIKLASPGLGVQL